MLSVFVVTSLLGFLSDYDDHWVGWTCARVTCMHRHSPIDDENEDDSLTTDTPLASVGAAIFIPETVFLRFCLT